MTFTLYKICPACVIKSSSKIAALLQNSTFILMFTGITLGIVFTFGFDMMNGEGELTTTITINNITATTSPDSTTEGISRSI